MIIRPVYRAHGCVTLTMTAETVVTKHKIVVCNFEMLLFLNSNRLHVEINFINCTFLHHLIVYGSLFPMEFWSLGFWFVRCE